MPLAASSHAPVARVVGKARSWGCAHGSPRISTASVSHAATSLPPMHDSRWRRPGTRYIVATTVGLVITTNRPFGGIAFVSGMNQAAAFERISCSPQLVLTPQPAELPASAVVRSSPRLRIAFPLRHPIPDRLCRRFELMPPRACGQRAPTQPSDDGTQAGRLLRWPSPEQIVQSIKSGAPVPSLDGQLIKDWFSPRFFATEFWLLWSTR